MTLPHPPPFLTDAGTREPIEILWRAVSEIEAGFTATPPGGAAGGALDGTFPNPGLASSVAGYGLTESSNVLAVNTGELGQYNVRDYGALGDGSTDDTASFTSALTAAGSYGTIYIPPGTYILSDLPVPAEGVTFQGAGLATVLKAKAAASYVVKNEGKRYTAFRDLIVDGNGRASSGVLLNATATPATSQNILFDRVRFYRCSIGLHVGTGGGGINQADKNTLIAPQFIECATSLQNDSPNGQETVLIGVDFTSGTGTNVKMSGGTLRIIGGQFQGGSQTCIEFTGSGVDWVSLEDVICETGGAVDIDGDTYWPRDGVHAVNAVFQGTTYNVDMGPNDSVFHATQCRFNNAGVGGGIVRATGNGSVFVETLCSYAPPVWTSTGTNAHIRNDELLTVSKESSAHNFIQASVYGDTQQRFTVDASGAQTWGSGSAAGDTNLYRSAANTLKTDDALIIGGAATITSGSVSGITDLAVADGGTGASTDSGARTNLGLIIGTDVEAHDATLTALAGLATGANKFPYSTGTDTFSQADFIPWTTWSPSWTNLTVGAGTVTARYTQVGKTVNFRIGITLAADSSISGSVSFSLPVTSAAAIGSGINVYGPANFLDSGTDNLAGVVAYLSTTTAAVYRYNAAATNVPYNALSSTVPFTWTTSDAIFAEGWYEAA